MLNKGHVSNIHCEAQSCISATQRPKHKKYASHHVWHHTVWVLRQIHHFTLNWFKGFFFYQKAQLNSESWHPDPDPDESGVCSMHRCPNGRDFRQKSSNILVQFVRHPVVYSWNLKQFHKMTEHLCKNYWGYMKTHIQQRLQQFLGQYQLISLIVF